MENYHSFLNELINRNHEAFGKYEELEWMNPYGAIEFEEQRDAILQSFSDKVRYEFKQTKPWINSISKGCRLCGQGDWSCLFITGKCNANCFYCPAPQEADDLPTAQQLRFDQPKTYAEFINHFGFKGCSFSGGEPLLVFDRTLDFLKTIRRQCSPELYIWMYTNGILASEDKFKALAGEGINEVRFDIGATNYHLQGLRKAKGIIPVVTVEIPMVPEELEQLKSLLPQLMEAGVTNLNLHQLRLTTHNVARLKDHPYTYLHGEHPHVLESELAVLDLMKFVDEQNLGIGVNYCSFQYKHRFQKAGYRAKIASKLISANEAVTENGYIRRISVPANNGFRSISEKEFLENHGHISSVKIEYLGTVLNDSGKQGEYSRAVSVGNTRYPVEEGNPCRPVILEDELINGLVAIINGQDSVPEDARLFDIWKHERIEPGLRNYF